MHASVRLGRKLDVTVLILSVGFLVALPLLNCGGYASSAYIGASYNNTPDDISYLTQYGVWINVAPYGQVWQPYVSPDWRPFTYGHWVWTANGWAWVSHEPYGWLVYHYGYWDYKPGIGWFWIEGIDWSPATVQWIVYGGYVAWAPLPPPGITWPEPWHQQRFHPWTVIRDRDFDRDNISHYRLKNPPGPGHMERRDIFHRAPERHEIERSTGKIFSPVELKHRPVPVYMQPEHRPQRKERGRSEAPPEEKTPKRGEEYGRPGENRQEQPRQAEARAPENNRGEKPQGEARAPESNRGEKPQGEARAPESNRGEKRQGEARGQEERQNENRPVQLRRMELPQKERDRVEKHRKDVERHVLKHKSNRNERGNEGRKKK